MYERSKTTPQTLRPPDQLLGHVEKNILFVLKQLGQ
jgi:hypothetical protein